MLRLELQRFYSILCSDFSSRARPISPESQDSPQSAEISLRNLRDAWYSDEELSTTFEDLRARSLAHQESDREIAETFSLIQNLWGEPEQTDSSLLVFERLATTSSWICEARRLLDEDILPWIQASWKTQNLYDSLPYAENCVHKLCELSADFDFLKRMGLLSECHAETITHELRISWFNVRDFLIERCVKTPVPEELSGRCFSLIDDYLKQSESMRFANDSLKRAHGVLCNQFVLIGSRRHQHRQSSFCTHHRSYRSSSLYQPSWLTEVTHRLVKDHPLLAVTKHSLPEISTIFYPTLAFEAKAGLTRWSSAPQILHDSPAKASRYPHHRRLESCSFSEAEDNSMASTPILLQPSRLSNTGEGDRLSNNMMRVSQRSFSTAPSANERESSVIGVDYSNYDESSRLHDNLDGADVMAAGNYANQPTVRWFILSYLYFVSKQSILFCLFVIDTRISNIAKSFMVHNLSTNYC